MKNLIAFLALLAITTTASAQAFTSHSVQRNGQTDQIHFSVKEETNIRYYMVEGSRDNTSFEILGRLEAKDNSRLPQSYKAAFYDTSVRYFRIRQVDLTAAGQYSSLLQVPQASVPYQATPTTEETVPTTILSSNQQ